MLHIIMFRRKYLYTEYYDMTKILLLRYDSNAVWLVSLYYFQLLFFDKANSLFIPYVT